MSEEKSREAFLDRWSRLKKENAAQEPAKEGAAPPAERGSEVAPALPAIEKLTPESDFKPFMDSKVDLGTRRDALKKLFTDPHFSIPDPFEPYSIDLTGEDPIPTEMLKTLDHAKRLLFDEPEKAVAAVEEKPAEIPQSSTQSPDDVAGKQDA